MTKWNKLPIEVLELIVDALDDESRCLPLYKTRWMLVKKQWFELFQSRYYKSVSLSLQPTDRIVQNILYSPYFKPGKYVKNITFEDL